MRIKNSHSHCHLAFYFYLFIFLSVSVLILELLNDIPSNTYKTKDFYIYHMLMLPLIILGEIPSHQFYKN